MIAKWREGFDVVYGQRARRKGETFFKRFTSAAFYRLLQKLTDVDIPVDTGDFRLIDRKGRVVATLDASSCDQANLSRMMVGESIARQSS